MSKRLSSAPGKLVIAGEYAVLEGYPGIVTAVGKRAYVTSEPAPNWQMQTQGRGLVDLPCPTAEFELINQLLNAAQNQKNLSPPKKFKIDSSALYHQTKDKICKLGLGSSAAVTTCLAAQCLDSSFFDIDAIFALSFTAHKAFMHETGSGIDISASCYGGILSFQLSPEIMLPSITPSSALAHTASIPLDCRYCTASSRFCATTRPITFRRSVRASFSSGAPWNTASTAWASSSMCMQPQG